MGTKKLLSKLTSKVLSRGASDPTIDNFTIWDQQPNQRPIAAREVVYPTNGAKFSVRPEDRYSQNPGRTHGSAQSKSGIAHSTRYYDRFAITNDDQGPVPGSGSSITDINWDKLDEAQAQEVFRQFSPGLSIGSIDWSQLDEKQTHDLLLTFPGTAEVDEPRIFPSLESPDKHQHDGHDQPSPIDSAKSFGEPQVAYDGKGKGRLRDFEPADLGKPMLGAQEFGPMQEIMDQELHLEKEMAQQLKDWQDRMKAIKARKDAELERHRKRQAERLRLLEEQRKEALRRAEEEKMNFKAASLLHEEEVRECLEREEEERRLAAEAQARLEEEERVAAQLAAMRDCVVCGDSKHPLDFPIKTPTAKCEHRPQTCVDCLQSWIASEFEAKGCQGLTCSECPRRLQHEDVQRIASEATFAAYETILTRNALSQLPDFAWCLAAGCGAGQLNVEAVGDYMECHSCKYQQCLKHKCAWHKDETCQQYDYRTSGQKARDEERATEAILDDISKKCPGEKCGWRIQKTEGCDHMTCRRCQHQFCWQCLAPHAEIKRIGNTAHQSWCKFHSDNLKPDWPFNAH